MHACMYTLSQVGTNERSIDRVCVRARVSTENFSHTHASEINETERSTGRETSLRQSIFDRCLSGFLIDTRLRSRYNAYLPYREMRLAFPMAKSKMKLIRSSCKNSIDKDIKIIFFHVLDTTYILYSKLPTSTKQSGKFSE